jgi:hypothetical protein
MDGLTFKEVLLGILFPLVIGAYAYAWMGAHALWQGLKDLRTEMKADLQTMRENDLHALEDRIERLERGR